METIYDSLVSFAATESDARKPPEQPRLAKVRGSMNFQTRSHGELCFAPLGSARHTSLPGPPSVEAVVSALAPEDIPPGDFEVNTESG